MESIYEGNTTNGVLPSVKDLTIPSNEINQMLYCSAGYVLVYVCVQFAV